jgi:hypothetical protein
MDPRNAAQSFHGAVAGLTLGWRQVTRRQFRLRSGDRLLVAQRLNRIELGSLAGGIKSEKHADRGAERDGHDH